MQRSPNGGRRRLIAAAALAMMACSCAPGATAGHSVATGGASGTGAAGGNSGSAAPGAPGYIPLQEGAPGPTPRRAGALALDGVEQRMILVGGLDPAGAPVAGTAEWDGRRWGVVDSSAPSARVRPGIAWDPASAQVVLYGDTTRDGGTGATDTWTWDGASWTRRSPAHAPQQAIDPALCWDSSTGQLLLLGVKDGGQWSTWTWSQDDWLKSDAATPDGTGGRCVDDTGAHRLLFTAPAMAASPGGAQGMVAWDGRQWADARMAAPGPSPALVNDAAEHTLVAVTADGATWTTNGYGFGVSHPGADGNIFSQAAYGYYPPLSMVLCFGGVDGHGGLTAETSAWDGRNWNLLLEPVTTPTPRVSG